SIRIPLTGGATLFASPQVGRTADDEDRRALDDLAARLAVVAAAGEPKARRDRRLTRIDALGGALRTLERVLALRDVFGEWSGLLRQALPHDVSLIGLYAGSHRRLRLHALNVPAGWTLPSHVDNPYPAPLDNGCNFTVHRDMATHPIER